MKMRFRISLTLSLVAVIVTFFVVTLVNIRMITGQSGREFGNQLFTVLAQSVDQEATGLIETSLDLASIMAVTRDPGFILDAQMGSSDAFKMLQFLRDHPDLYSVYFGFDTDDFFQLIAMRGSEKLLTVHKAPPDTSWIMRVIKTAPTGKRTQVWSFYSDDMTFLSERREDAPAYRPTKRPWYHAAYQTQETVLSDTYIFSSSGLPGITASRQFPDGTGVVGVDLTLDALGEFLNSLETSENGHIAVLDSQRQIVAHAPAETGVALMAGLSDLSAMSIPQLTALVDRMNGTLSPSSPYLVHLQKVGLPGVGMEIAIIAPVSDFLGSFDRLQDRILWANIVGILFLVPLSFYLSGGLTRRLSHLVSDARKIANLDFSKTTFRASPILEFNELDTSFDRMREALQDHSTQLNVSQNKLNRLVELGIAISAERETSKVMSMLMNGAREITNCDGCTLYMVKDDRLEFQIILNHTLGLTADDHDTHKPDLPDVPLYLDDGKPNNTTVVSQAVHAAKTIHIADVYNNSDFTFSGTQEFDALNGYRSQSFLTVPLKPRGGRVIGALQLLNAMDADGGVIPFDDEITRMVESLAAQAATVLYNRDLQQGNLRLMDSFIKLIAGAIDTKSPHTGSHCARVPELAAMLAQAASDSKTGPFADFTFKTKDEWREFSIGTWLHDCGKVVTPEYVVDKATKLETIHNRIHDIRNRFEILLRDAHIASLEAILDGADPVAESAALSKIKAELIDDFAFVADCNIGSESMPVENLARLQHIAQRTYIRQFDNRLGLAHEEALRFAAAPEAPAVEHLIQDQAWHIIERHSDVEAQYAGLGFKMDIPEHLYNRGELYNLSIKSGTLSAEERFKINEHIMQTIAMLEQLPYPDHLKRIPEYAGTHHETLTGKGYPRKLDESQLSIPARVMAIADIFEALTASDRPYKKGKTLSESVHILSKFKERRHIDGALFDLFLTSGVYRDYAHRFLKPEQIDDVDISQYVGAG